MEWFVYIIRCSDDSLYTGITTDVQRRFEQHGNGSGAKYFRGRAPKEIVFVENGHNRSSASVREAAIKKMPVDGKLRLIASDKNQLLLP